MALVRSEVPDTYRGIERHWCPVSEPYTGCDSLFAAMEQGWRLSGVVFCETFTYSQSRTSHVFHFQLVDSDHLLRMPIISSPPVINFIVAEKLTVLSERDLTEAGEIALTEIRQLAALA
jgi:hypothetical protein